MTTPTLRATARRAQVDRRPLALALLAALGLLASACTGGDVESPPVAPATEASAPEAATATDASGDGIADTATAPAPASDDESAAVVDPGADLAAELSDLAGADSVAVVEDWTAFDDASAVEAAIGRNLGMGANAMTLTLGAGALSPELDAGALAIAYDIGAEAPHDFVGFDRTLEAPMDWSDAQSVALWLDPAMAPGVDVVFQFREASGEVWRYQGPMPDAEADAPLLLPLDDEHFAWATWSREENGAIDLGAVDQYGVYIGHAGPGRRGVVTMGPIALVR